MKNNSLKISKIQKHAPQRKRQSGVVLLFALVALTIILIGAVAIINSVTSSLTSAGNIAFKRDMLNQAESAAAQVVAQFNNSATLIGTPTLRAINRPTLNYSATAVNTNSRGIPNDLLLKNSDFTGAGWSLAADMVQPGGITLRYIVDRLCSTTGNSQELAPELCIRAPKGLNNREIRSIDESRMKNEAAIGSVEEGVEAAVRNPAAYRLTIRASGPRDAQAFYQVVFTEPLPAPAPIP